MLAPDTILSGRYRVVRVLDSGGMGDVYEALELGLGRPVAIKVLNEDVASDPVMAQRFRREAVALAALGHPNIVNIIEFRADAGSDPILVMEKLEGASLRAVLKADGQLAPARAIAVVLQILSALSAAHRTGIVHRDIKPGNVFLVPTLAVPDFVKVIDFGIAKVDASQLTRAPLTMMGEVLGTLLYMAPEQAMGKPIDPRADLFSVGAILFEALSGERARVFDSWRGHASIFLPCRPLAEVMPFVDPRLAAVVDRALAFEPNDRFPSAEAMVLALTSAASAPPRETLASRAAPTQMNPRATATVSTPPPGPALSTPPRAGSLEQTAMRGTAPLGVATVSTRSLASAPAPAVAFIPPAPGTGPLARKGRGVPAWLIWAAPLGVLLVGCVGAAIALLAFSQADPESASKGSGRAAGSPSRHGSDPTFSSVGVPQCDLFLRHYYHYGDNLPGNYADQMHTAARQLHDVWLKVPARAATCEERDRVICGAEPSACQ